MIPLSADTHFIITADGPTPGIGLAPVAAAAPTACTDTGNATQCQTPGNVQINTEPRDAALNAAGQQYPFFGYGYGGALLFHHGGNR